ncbi:Uncharacterised protein [Klebsiella variicola]|uniref:hypothetical protein n=1 Tax=Klebsiella variicola TaxID=244366 RepID=UPI0009D15DEC|nr:hypothetical protein [Klebsiella variicola]SLV16678.1 Uncharacterised protein [Klebsiella variicola]SLW53367.1 Uncharacterised protein [Klebsiella variicola]SLZ48545.1 Uncharacterised protein [Klebsiella variicola]SMA02621.1 Uncharacterised protein [Klebsiella variicola]SMA13481.1 Uncharacterised protein [Klebsiella variicola]
MTDITELAQSEINDALAQLKQISEYPTPSTQYARVLRKYFASLVEALELKEEQRANWSQMAQKLGEDLDAAEKRIAELEREQEQLRPVGVMSEKAFHRLENRNCRFIALWPRPGIFLQRKRPEDGVIVYALTVAAAGIKVEAE